MVSPLPITRAFEIGIRRDGVGSSPKKYPRHKALRVQDVYFRMSLSTVVKETDEDVYLARDLAESGTTGHSEEEVPCADRTRPGKTKTGELKW